MASFVEFFVWLLVLKTFFLPLFIIPTGSMAETLYGAHATHTCPNCGFEYPVGFDRAPGRASHDPQQVRCPNCRWVQRYSQIKRELKPTAGDRIMVHGWPFVFGGYFGPHNWDVVVFRNPASPGENYIKRLIGLPHQEIEIINGDIFIDGKVARKPPTVQRALWFNVYDHDYSPKEPARQSGYFPHWSDLGRDSAWHDVDTRTPEFDGADQKRGEIRFLTRIGDTAPYCDIIDEYGYNEPGRRGPPYSVSDVRVSCEVQIQQGKGYVELATTKQRRRYMATLFADGRVTLDREDSSGERTSLATAGTSLSHSPIGFALSVVDHSAQVEIDGKPVASWRDEGLNRARARELTLAEQRSRNAVAAAQKITIAAADLKVRCARLKVQRDVYYTWRSPNGQPPPRAVLGHPLQLEAGEYFVLGDNSPSSLDGRFWQNADVRLEGTGYRLGTVPADQMIGRAFFVYWPGFLPLWKDGPVFGFGGSGSGPNLLPNFGKVRWIY